MIDEIEFYKNYKFEPLKLIIGGVRYKQKQNCITKRHNWSSCKNSYDVDNDEILHIKARKSLVLK